MIVEALRLRIGRATKADLLLWPAALVFSAVILLWPAAPSPFIWQPPLPSPLFLGQMQFVHGAPMLAETIAVDARQADPSHEYVLRRAEMRRLRLEFPEPHHVNDGGIAQVARTLSDGRPGLRFTIWEGGHALRLGPLVASRQPILVEMVVRRAPSSNPWPQAGKGPTPIAVELYNQSRGETAATLFRGHVDQLKGLRTISAVAYVPGVQKEKFVLRIFQDAWSGDDLVEIRSLSYSCLGC